MALLPYGVQYKSMLSETECRGFMVLASSDDFCFSQQSGQEDPWASLTKGIVRVHILILDGHARRPFMNPRGS